MKAAFIERFGGPEVLKYGDLPDPAASPSEVVVDVVAASINGADWKVRAGQYSEAKFPLVLGRDFSGARHPESAFDSLPSWNETMVFPIRSREPSHRIC